MQSVHTLRRTQSLNLPANFSASLAWAELYLTVATVFSRFDFEFSGTGLEDVECRSDQFAVGTTGKNGVKVAVKRADVN